MYDTNCNKDSILTLLTISLAPFFLFTELVFTKLAPRGHIQCIIKTGTISTEIQSFFRFRSNRSNAHSWFTHRKHRVVLHLYESLQLPSLLASSHGLGARKKVPSSIAFLFPLLQTSPSTLNQQPLLVSPFSTGPRPSQQPQFGLLPVFTFQTTTPKL